MNQFKFELTYDHGSSMRGFLVDRHCLVCRESINHGGLICVVPLGNFSGPVVCPDCIPGFNSSLEEVIRMRQAEVSAYGALSPYPFRVAEDSTVRILEALRGNPSPFPSQDDLAAAEATDKAFVVSMVWKLADDAISLLLPAVKDDDLLNRMAMGLVPEDGGTLDQLWLAMAEDFVSCYYAANNLPDDLVLASSIDKRTAIRDFLVDRVGLWWHSQKALEA